MSAAIIEGLRLSPAQQRIWSRQQIAESPLYQAYAEIRGDLSVSALSDAASRVVGDHEILRTVFRPGPRAAEGLQFIRERAHVSIRLIELNAGAAAVIEGSLRELAAEDARACRRDGEPVFSLARFAPDRHRLIVTIPALCADHFSVDAVIRQIAASYDDRNYCPLTGDSLQYADLSESLGDLLDSPEAAAGHRYWNDPDWVALLARDLPIEYRRSSETGFRPASHTLYLESEIVETLASLSGRAGVSIEACLLGCWQALLWNLLERSDFVVGVTLDGRRQSELRDILGPLERPVPVICSTDSRVSFKQFARQLQQTLDGHRALMDFFSWAGPDSEIPPETFFPLQFEFRAAASPIKAAALDWELLSVEGRAEQHRLLCSCRPEGDRLRVEFAFDAAAIDPRDVEALANQFVDLAAAVAGNYESPLAGINFSDGATSQVGHAAGQIAEQSAHKSEPASIVAELFVEQARKTPDRIAVVAPDGVRTYKEMLDEAACISAHLRNSGVGPDVAVALLVERSAATLSALWGILLSGGAYMPVEPGAPPAYIARQLAESGVSLLLASRRMSDRAPESGVETLLIEELIERGPATASTRPVARHPEHLAYVICTSGSTGAPKSVGVLQGGLSNYTRALTERLRDQETDGPLNFALVSTLAADLGNTCLFPALTTGACLHLISSELVLDAQAFADYMTANRIDVLKIVPSHLRALLSHGPAVLPARWLIVGGEAFTAELFDRIRAAGASCGVINHYGPTETTVGSLMESVDEAAPILLPPVLPVGLPIRDTQAYVLDEQMRPAAINMAGELYIAGAGLARGYLSRPDLTAERFVPNPFSSEPGGRLYRTGDRARLRREGRVQILGRTDSQVKIRGYRIELGEVESAVCRHESVEAAAAVVIEDANGGKRLVAVLTARDGYKQDSAELRRFLATELPAQMAPSEIIWVQALPLTPNGKLDRKRLVAVAAERESARDGEPSPLSPIESTIAEIWSQALGLEQVGVTDDFFELGGDSISAIQITARLRKAGLALTPLQLFENPTVAGLAAAVTPAAPKASLPATETAAENSAPEDEAYPLSPLQEGMLFFALNSSGERLYVSELVCTFREGFDPEAFARAWQRVIERHSIFRTGFHWEEEPEPRQIACADVKLRIDRLDWSDRAAAEQQSLLAQYCEEAHRGGIDLRVPPLMRLALIHLSRGRYQFVWIYHHLLMDAWSEAILNDELFAYYDAFKNGRECARPVPPPFRDYIDWYNRQDKTRAESFWRNYLRGFCSPTPLLGATEVGKPSAGPSAWDMVQVVVPAGEAAMVRDFTRARRLTLNTLVQGAWALVLGEQTGKDDVVFGATVAGRPEDLAGADSIIGPFLNTIPVRVVMPREATVVEWLARLQREQAEAREHEHAPLIQVQSWSELPRGTPFFDSFIGFQNASMARVSMAGGDGQPARFSIESRSFRGGWTNYPVSLDVEPGEEIVLTISFDKERVTPAGARQFLACVHSALSLIREKADLTLEELRRSFAAARREHVARQQKGFSESRRSQINSLRRRG